jgi:outer membrane protein TolC
MNRRFLIALITLFALAFGARGRAEPAQGMTLREAVAVALEKNPAVQAADAYAEAVEQGIAEAKAGRYPRLDFSETVMRGNNPVYVFGTLLTQRQFESRHFALNFLNTPPPLNNFRTQFSAQMPLYDFGRTPGRVKDARLDAEAAAAGRRRTRQEVIFQVVGTYLNALLAREGERVALAAVEAAESDLHRARAREEQGLAVSSDVLSAQVQLAQAKEDLIRARNGVALACAAFNVALGLPEDAATEIAGTLEEARLEAGTLGDRQARALATRPDFAEATLGAERAANGTRLARSEFLPKLDLFSSWEQDNQRFLSRGGNNWTVGASLSFNLFDGGANRARLAQSRARERQARARREQMANGVRLQVREAFLNLDAARQRLEVSRESAAQAAESLRILRDRYEAGLATITDVLRAETMHTSAQRNFLNALFDYRIGFAALEFATGELGPDSPAVTR